MLHSWTRVLLHTSNISAKTFQQPLILNFVKRSRSGRVIPANDINDSDLPCFPDILSGGSFYEREKKLRRKKSSDDESSPKNKESRKDEPVIQCKRPEYNHYKNQKYKDFNVIPLASKGWRRSKSKGDHFSILIYSMGKKPESKKDPAQFGDLQLDPRIVDVLIANGIHTPTEIQVKAIPHILSGKSCVLSAETGCGKTLAYLLPIIQQILAYRQTHPDDQKLNSPSGLIITPSRDLSEQIFEVASWFTKEFDFNCKVLIGGRGKKQMLNANFEDVDLLVASFGVLSKFMTNAIYSKNNIRHVVLDEADTLLDDSFNEQLLHFFKRIQFSTNQGQDDPGAQLVLASATIPTSLANLLANAVDIDNVERITTQNLHSVLPHVKQTFYRVGKSEKPVHLLKHVKSAVKNRTPMIVFCNKAITSDWVSEFLNNNNVRCLNLNGNLASDVRVGRFKMFQKGEVDVLATTDICSRGLDTLRVKRVLNYDFPWFISDYIHRCGRTGRIGSPDNCEVINLVTKGDKEVELVQKIELAVRTMTSFENVNANINRILNNLQDKGTKYVPVITSDPTSLN